MIFVTSFQAFDMLWIWKIFIKCLAHKCMYKQLVIGFKQRYADDKLDAV